MKPDRAQAELLRCQDKRILLNCSRQWGKSTVAAALALREALLVPNSLVLLLSPTLRQSSECFKDKLLRIYNALRRPVPAVQESALSMQLANGSRIVALPGEESTVRGYSSVALLVIDEAARVSDAMYLSVRPMLAVSRGRLIALSSPYGRRGWFFKEWGEGKGWRRLRVVATECPRITPEFLAEERRTLGERWYRQEYETSFEATVDAVFDPDSIEAACTSDVRPAYQW